jgi:hypothetical protein
VISQARRDRAHGCHTSHTLVKITYINAIMGFGVMMTLALVVDG